MKIFVILAQHNLPALKDLITSDLKFCMVEVLDSKAGFAVTPCTRANSSECVALTGTEG